MQNSTMEKTDRPAGSLRQLVKVIWGLARQGNAIILGRGANWFLNAEFGLRIRVIAPLEVRAEYLARMEHVSLVEAGKRVKEHDAKQTASQRDPIDSPVVPSVGSPADINDVHSPAFGRAVEVKEAVIDRM